MGGVILLKKETKIKRTVISLAESEIPSESNVTKFHKCMSILDVMSDDEENEFFFDLDEITITKVKYEILRYYGLHK